MRRNEDGEKKPTSRDVFIAARRLLFRAAAPAFVYFVFLFFNFVRVRAVEASTLPEPV